MPPIPKKMSRKTKHTPPRCQLYQPGFNEANSCWLDGHWVTVPKEGFTERAKAHQKLYAGVRKAAQKQSWRGKGTKPKNMTPAQRQAWEHYSGDGDYDVRYETGYIGKCRLEMAGGKPKPSSLKWLKGRGAKVIPKVLQPNGMRKGKQRLKEVDQSKGVPDDMLTDDAEPVDVWKLIVRQNQQRMSDFADAMADMAMEGKAGDGQLMNNDFALGVALNELLQIEEGIIRLETSKNEDPYDTIEGLQERYRTRRTKMETKLGDKFKDAYESAKRTHNSCARTNLDNSDGFLGSYVLPAFHQDGTHEPIGERDFPWGRDD